MDKKDVRLLYAGLVTTTQMNLENIMDDTEKDRHRMISHIRGILKTNNN